MNTLDSQLQVLETALQQAEQAAAAGRYINLEPLRPQVEMFCNDLLQAPAADAWHYLPHLTRIIAGIDQAAAAIRQAGALSPSYPTSQDQNG